MNKIDSVLQPVLNDRALIALMRLKFVPLNFIQQRCGVKTTRKATIELIQAFECIKDAPDVIGDGYTMSFCDATPHFQIIKKTVHVSIGLDAAKAKSGVMSAKDLIEAINQRLISLDASVKEVASEFKNDQYVPLTKQLEKYRKILAECDRSLDLDTALSRTNTDMATWRRLKSSMARYGLSQDVRFARNVLLPGSLCDQIEQMHYGQNLQEVISALLRKAL